MYNLQPLIVGLALSIQSFLPLLASETIVGVVCTRLLPLHVEAIAKIDGTWHG